ncbi:MAG TPA: hypothetical protein VGP85_10725 [Pyrinomonadaceae bacterium]|nr:hypothetical protein [Pyrinomonadaceae bacterium]
MRSARIIRWATTTNDSSTSHFFLFNLAVCPSETGSKVLPTLEAGDGKVFPASFLDSETIVIRSGDSSVLDYARNLVDVFAT